MYGVFTYLSFLFSVRFRQTHTSETKKLKGFLDTKKINTFSLGNISFYQMSSKIFLYFCWTLYMKIIRKGRFVWRSNLC